MISVIMAHYKREELLYRTLWAYRHQHTPEELKDVEFVIVDDDGGRSETFWKVLKVHSKALNITAASMDEGTNNASGPMNYGIKLSKGEFIVLTNPENIPYTPHLLTKMFGSLEKWEKYYCSGACYSMDKFDTDTLVLSAVWEDKKSCLNAIKSVELKKREYGVNGLFSGWRQHSKYYPGHLYFLVGIHRESLLEIGGFDEDYMKGQGREDVDLVCRVKKKGLVIKHSDELVVLHQFHFWPDSHKLRPNRKKMWEINNKTFLSKQDLDSEVRNAGKNWGCPESGTKIRSYCEDIIS